MAAYLKTSVAAAALVVVLPFAPNALAHHVMGGALPSTGWQGLLSGLGHPIIGLDHLAFVVAVGLMSQFVGRVALLPLLFVVGTVLGCFVHVQGMSIPLFEPAIAFTVAAAAVVVAAHPQIPIGILAILFSASGVLHGYAYGESIVGTETQTLAAYVIGFSMIQYCLAVGIGAALHLVVRRDYVSETTALRVGSGGIALVATLAFVNIAQAG